MKFIIYRDKKKEFRWRLLARNGKIIADSGEGYRTRTACKKSILRVCESATAKVIDESIIPKTSIKDKEKSTKNYFPNTHEI